MFGFCCFLVKPNVACSFSFISHSITFFMATGLTTIVFITDKREGLLDRSQVAGILFTQIVTHTKII